MRHENRGWPNDGTSVVANTTCNSIMVITSLIVHFELEFSSVPTMDSPDINSTHSGSHLLSMDTPTFSSESQTGPGGDDLSLSELSISKDSIMNKPFSLLANFNPRTRPVDPTTPTRLNESGLIAEDLQLAGDSNEAEGDFEDERDAELVQRNAQEVRDEKLKSDVFVLKKLNAAFDLFHEALEETGNANQVRGCF